MKMCLMRVSADGSRRLVAVFMPTAQAEAERCLQACNQDTKLPHTYRMEIEGPPSPPEEEREHSSCIISIDSSLAKRSGRAIAVRLSWDVTGHGTRNVRCWHKLYGTVRAEIADTPFALNYFIGKIAEIWPNATITS